MICLLDTSEELEIAENEISCKVEQLLTPLTRFKPQKPNEHFAIDNGAFSKKGFNAKAFLALLQREKERKDLCRFVAVPDVVGSARRTLEAFEYWYPTLCGWKLALVAQDGLENLPIPWNLIDAVFIGGSTKWKESDASIAVIRTAQMMGKWVHIGRINKSARFEAFEQIKADSTDGTGISQYSWMREGIANRNQNRLFTQTELTNIALVV